MRPPGGDRVPPGEPPEAMREGLMRNLLTKHAKGNRDAVEILFRQFEVALPWATLNFTLWFGR